jgi:hypothetical protein
VRYLGIVALVTVGTPAVADVDPAVMAMLREWSLASPDPSRVVICHGFGCAFRTEIALTDAGLRSDGRDYGLGGCLG